MRFIVFVLLLLSLPIFVFSTTCAVDGSSWVYQETISGQNREIYTNMCPNHYSGCQKRQCDGTVSESIENPTTWTIPAYPVLGTSSYWFDVLCYGGPVGIALNGANIYSQFDGHPEDCGDAVQSESSTFDLCGGHADFSDYYHYHIPPTCLIDQLGDMPDGHSPQVGWAIDGFPIYGPKGPSGVDMYPCTHSNADSTYCLDECNGYEGALNGIDEFLYRYYTVGPTGDLTCSDTVLNSDRGTCDGQGNCCINEVPDTSYNPYTIGCLKGCRNNNPGCLNTGSVGYTYNKASISDHPDSVYDVFASSHLYRGESSSTLQLNMSSLDYDVIEDIYCNALVHLLEVEEGDEWNCISSSISIKETSSFTLNRALSFLKEGNFMRKEGQDSSSKPAGISVLSSSALEVEVSATLEGRGSVNPEQALTNQAEMESALETAFQQHDLGQALLQVVSTSWVEGSSDDDGNSKEDDESFFGGEGFGKGGIVVGSVVLVGVMMAGVFVWRKRSKEDKFRSYQEPLIN